MTRLLVLKEDDLECIWRHHSQITTHDVYMFDVFYRRKCYVTCDSYAREVTLRTRKTPIIKYLRNHNISFSIATYRIHEYPLNLL